MPKIKEIDQKCPVCVKSTYDRRCNTICCAKCKLWIHFKCARVTNKDACVKQKDVPYYCTLCLSKRNVIPKGIVESSSSYQQNNDSTSTNNGQSKITYEFNYLINQYVTNNQNNNYMNCNTRCKKGSDIQKYVNMLKKQALEIQKFEDMLHNTGIKYKELKDENSMLLKEINNVKEENKKLKLDAFIAKEEIARLREMEKICGKTKLENEKLLTENKDMSCRLHTYKKEHRQLKENEMRKDDKLEGAKKLITYNQRQLETKSKEFDEQKTEMMNRISILQQQKKKYQDISRSIQHERDKLEISNSEISKLLEYTLEIHRTEEEKLEKKHKIDIQLQIQHYEREKNIWKLYCRDRDEKLEELRRLNDRIVRKN